MGFLSSVLRKDRELGHPAARLPIRRQELAWKWSVGVRKELLKANWAGDGMSPRIYLDAGTIGCVVGATSLVGSVGFKSHLHNGHRVATVYTIRPKTEHFALGQIFMCATCFARSPEICARFQSPSTDK
jgi:hypothetical protein